jgi:hypothetical protein
MYAAVNVCDEFGRSCSVLVHYPALVGAPLSATDKTVIVQAFPFFDVRQNNLILQSSQA